jgi:hypothetical protein
MKKEKFGLYLFLGLFMILFASSAETEDVIYWSSDYRLTWDDFAGEPRFDYEAIGALTSSGIIHYKGCKDGDITFKVQAYFEKNESWVKEEALTSHHLIHEQIHFDITELAVRRLRKSLKERKFKCGEEVEFENFANFFIENWRLEQNAFDLMSRHSLNKEQQEVWFHKVAMELSLLEE